MDISKVLIHKNASIGFTGIISLTDNPDNHPCAIGGIRCLPVSFDDALADAQRLSISMYHKAKNFHLPHFGGKSFIIQPPTATRKDCMIAFAKMLNELHGQYIGSFDSGITKDDLNIIGQHSPYTAAYGDTIECGNVTAMGVFYSILAVADSLKKPLQNCHVAIQGLGAVGSALAKLCLNAGAKVTASDTNPERLVHWQSHVNIVSPDKILSTPCDVLAPCALSHSINMNNAKQLNCTIICGGANNQLEHESIIDILKQKHILFIPEGLNNVGGLMLQSHYFNHPNTPFNHQQLERIKDAVQAYISHHTSAISQ